MVRHYVRGANGFRAFVNLGSHGPRTGGFPVIIGGRVWETRQIAEALHLSVKTVESYQAHIKEKLSLRSARELVQHAVEWNVREKTALN